jgi:hypothetical protein
MFLDSDGDTVLVCSTRIELQMLWINGIWLHLDAGTTVTITQE